MLADVLLVLDQQRLRDLLVEHKQYICEHGDDMPMVKNWTWPA